MKTHARDPLVPGASTPGRTTASGSGVRWGTYWSLPGPVPMLFADRILLVKVKERLTLVALGPVARMVHVVYAVLEEKRLRHERSVLQSV